mmetsp:Transcript_4697/g.10561  ORF Transcript_4697/g.10561 Transcript_4697/m.10561 type:complete len:510 (+) Transcript_4697:1063-2592(+)
MYSLVERGLIMCSSAHISHIRTMYPTCAPQSYSDLLRQAKPLLQYLRVHQPGSRVQTRGVPRGAFRAATALPHVHELVAPGEVLLEHAAVVVLLLALRSVLGEGLCCACELLVRYEVLADVPLQGGHPGHAHALALHGLGAPHHLWGQLLLVHLAQKVLLAATVSPFSAELERRVESHGCLDVVHVEEGHARLQGAAHAHAVAALQVHELHRVEDAAVLLLQLRRLLALGVVEVATPDLVAALPSEHHLHVLGCLLGEEVVGYGGSDELWLVGLHVVYDLLQHGEGVLRGEQSLIVVCVQELRHRPRSHDVGRAFLPHCEGLDLAVRGGQVLPHVGLQHDRPDDGGVQAPRQQQADGHVSHAASDDCCLQSGTALLLSAVPLADRHVRAEGVCVPLRVVVLHHALLGSPVVSRGEGDQVLWRALAHDALELRGEEHLLSVPGPAHIQRLDAHLVASHQHLLPVVADQHECEHAHESVHDLGSDLVEPVDDDLTIALRLDDRVVQLQLLA